MEALRNLENKWKLSTKQALFLLLFAALGVIGLCLVATTKTTFLRRLKSRKSSTSLQLIIKREDEEEERNKKKKSADQERDPACGWAAIRTALIGSLRWSKASKWGEETRVNGPSSLWSETPLPLLEKRAIPRQRGLDHHDHHVHSHDQHGHDHHDHGAHGHGKSWPSHNSDSPVWQRPILMGEKCELPRFSGLILYNENGQLLCDVTRTAEETSSCINVTSSNHKEQSAAKVVRTTLRDLL